MSWRLPPLTYARVMSTLAVFFALTGGTAIASYVISSNSQIGPGTVSGHKPPAGKHANVIAGSLTTVDLANGAATAAKLAPSEAYRKVGTAGQPAFENGWHNRIAGSPASFYKDAYGVVHLRGWIAGGDNGFPVFTLPAGYRPAKELVMPAGIGAGDASSAAYLTVDPIGRVAPHWSSSPATIGIDGLTFRAGS